MRQVLTFAILFLAWQAQAQLSIQFLPFGTGLTEPTAIANMGDERLFIIEKGGYIQILDARGNLNSTAFLDIDARVSAGGERGLLGLAFHPDYNTNGYFFVNYTNNAGDTRISRFSRSTSNPDLADATSELILLTVDQPFSNHNAGDLKFGPDGFLYIPLGDGGSFGDPGNRSQNPAQLLGKMLRLDVDAAAPYIPASNPYVSNPAVLDAIWANGLRNPWRFSFDALTGDMWIADVGQDAREEINVQLAASTGGENYGWRCYEGNNTYNTSGCGPIGTYTFPIAQYTHSFSTGGFSVTGGYVYRGEGNPGMYGKYFYCDYITGNWWNIEPNLSGGYDVNPMGNLISSISSFGEDHEGELYVSNLDNGTIYKIVEECTLGSTPTGLDAIVLGPNTVSLAWDAIPGVSKYQVNGRPIGAPTFGSKQLNLNSITVNILISATDYEWFVQARCLDGTIADDSQLSFFTTPVMRESASVETDINLHVTPTQIYLFTTGKTNWQITDLSGRVINAGISTDNSIIEIGHLNHGAFLVTAIDQQGVKTSSLLYR